MGPRGSIHSGSVVRHVTVATWPTGRSEGTCVTVPSRCTRGSKEGPKASLDSDPEADTHTVSGTLHVAPSPARNPPVP